MELKVRFQQALDLRNKKAIDISRDLNIPKSAISQYLSGKSKNMTSSRLYAICKYLDVSEAWMMGYDVSIEREKKEKPTHTSELSENKQKLMMFLETVPEEKIDYVIRILSTILEGEE